MPARAYVELHAKSAFSFLEGASTPEQLAAECARNVYIELQRHGRRDQEYRNQALIPIAKSLNLPLLATNGSLYADVQSRPLQDVLTCLRHKKTFENVGQLLCRNSQLYLKSTEE